MCYENLKNQDPQVYAAIKAELLRQNEHIELIASENFTSPAVLEATCSVLTNKYAEGYPGARWYGGCTYVDQAEYIAKSRAKTLFGCEHVNVQPHSGTQANIAVYMAVLAPGDTILAMDLACGGHLSHGMRLNFSGKYFNIVSYGVDPKTYTIDYDQVRSLAKEHKPKLIVSGASAYPRVLDFPAFRSICDEVGAYHMADMAHIAGLVAVGLHPSPIPFAEFVTSTTHKTLRGPRGGFIMCKSEFAKKIDQAVFPGMQGGPLMHIIAAKAVAFGEALKDSFKTYQKHIITNAKVLSEALTDLGYLIVSGGTDNHLMLVDLRNKGLTGKDAALRLESVRITANKNLIPFDPAAPFVTSGIRLGTPAVTTRGMGVAQMRKIAFLINRALGSEILSANTITEITSEVKNLVDKFPLYSELRSVHSG